MKPLLNRLAKGDMFVISFLLFLLVVLAFFPSLRNGFINYDDDLYVYENTLVQSRLTWGAISWAFTNVDAGFWQPVHGEF